MTLVAGAVAVSSPGPVQETFWEYLAVCVTLEFLYEEILPGRASLSLCKGKPPVVQELTLMSP